MVVRMRRRWALAFGFLLAAAWFLLYAGFFRDGGTGIDPSGLDYAEPPPSEPVQLTDEEKAYLRMLGPVEFSVDPDWEPYERIDGEGRYVGIAADLFALIVGRIGVEARLVPTADWPESIEAVKTGRTDLLVFLNRTPEREKWLAFTEPYFTDPNVFITRSEHDFIFDPARLSGGSIVFPEGTSLEEKVRSRYPNLKILTAKSESEALSMVEDRKADMTLRSLTMAAYTIRKRGLFNLKVSGQLPEETNEFRIGVAQDLPLLRDILNKGIGSIGPSDLERIVNRHIAIQVQTTVDYGLLFGSFGLFASVAAAGALFIHRQRVHAAHLRTIIDAVPGYIFAKDAGGKYLLVNKAAASLFGLDPDEVVGKTDLDYGEDAERAAGDREADRKVIESGNDLFIPERQDLRPDRSLGWFQTTKTPYRHPGMKQPAVLGVSIDITERKVAELKLAESEKRFRFIAEHATDVIWVYDTEDRRFRYISPSVFGLRGFTPEEVIGQRLEDAVSPGSRKEVAEALVRAISEFRSGVQLLKTMEIEQPRKDGLTVWTEVTSKLTEDDVSGHLVLYGSSRDITERRHLEGEISKREELLRYVNDATGDGIWDWQVRDDWMVHNKSWCRILGLDGSRMGHPLHFFVSLVHPEDLERVQEALRDCLHGLKDYSAEYRLRHADGHYVWVMDRGRLVEKSADGAPLRVVGSIRDITELQELRKELELRATTDALTGTRNRRFFYEEAEREFARARRHGQPLAAMMLDLDFFKRVNDTYGHHAGDEVLRKTAEHFRNMIREGDLLGRLGGEEFAVLMPQTDSAGAAQLAERLRETFSGLRVAGDWEGEIAPTVSIGVADVLPADAGIEAAIARADKSLYDAKRAGRNCVRVFGDD